MIDNTSADAFLAPRYGEDWTDLDADVKTACLLKAQDYISATYTFIVDAPEEEACFKAATFYLAHALSTNALTIASSDAVASHEERLEGVVTEKTSYIVDAKRDPYPLVTKLLSPITARTGGFQVVGLTK